MLPFFILFFIIGGLCAIPAVIVLFNRVAKKNRERIVRLRQIQKDMTGPLTPERRHILGAEAAEIYLDVTKTNHRNASKEAQIIFQMMKLS
jgi:hypothetical protein